MNNTTKSTAFTPTRRGFVKTAGFALAGAAAIGLAGCTPSQEKAGGSAKADGTWDEEVDVVVVGAGIAGLAAAITVATEGNGASCLLIEKGSSPGGNSPFCKGDSIWTKEPAALAAYMKRMSHGTTPDDVLEVYSQGCAEIFDWMLELGAIKEEMSVTEPTTKETAEDRNAEYHEYEDSYAFGYFAVGKNSKVEVKGPNHIQTFLEQVLATHNGSVEYRTSTALVDLVQDESGAIIGVVAGDKKPKRIKAKNGVIMCLGGFEHNPEMMQNYLSQGAAIPGAGSLNTGDGHVICTKIGADFWHMNNVAGFWMAGRDLQNTTYTNPPIFKPAPKGFGITVGINGRRFYMDWDGYNVREKYPYMSDMTVHVGSRHGHMQFGGEWPHLPMPAKAWFVFDKDGLDKGALPPSEKGGTPDEKGYAHAANTIEELAVKMDVPVEELTTTVNQWNECCANGKDIFFHRPASTLTPVLTPPFYAQLCAPSFLNTDGGPVRNADGAILGYDGNPIPGLYSAGEFGSIWGHYYEGGGNVAECLVFGRISAKSALARAVK